MNMKKMCMAAVMVAGGTLGGYAQAAWPGSQTEWYAAGSGC